MRGYIGPYERRDRQVVPLIDKKRASESKYHEELHTARFEDAVRLDPLDDAPWRHLPGPTQRLVTLGQYHTNPILGEEY